MTLRVAHLTTYAANGGAARAATGLHRAMLRRGVDSRLVTAHGTRANLARAADRQLWRLQRSPVITWRSPARFGSMSSAEIDVMGVDIVNLHWVTDGFLSVEAIGGITTPRVWSMYDMWPFTGTEHYGVDAEDARWRVGYQHANRPDAESGVDLDRRTWERKRAHWSPMPMVPASRWLESATRSSALMGNWPVTRIPHVVDESVFAPMPRVHAGASWGVGDEGAVITFLASAGVTDHRKGVDLLHAALPAVVAAVGPVTVLVVGPQGTVNSPEGVTIVWTGPLSTDQDLRRAYSASDVVAVPSREDNMPLTAMEAQSSGRSVVAFGIGGLPDIVEHNETGFLAAAGDIAGLSEGLVQAIEGARSQDRWGDAARERAISIWSTVPVVDGYLDLYGSLR